MVKILLAVDGSEAAVRAARSLVQTAAWYKDPPRIEVITVHLPVPNVGGFSGAVMSREMVERYYAEEGEKSLAASKKVLDEAKITYSSHVLVGDVAQSIVDHARTAGCQMIYMGTRGMTGISNLLLGSIATKVLHLTGVPVVLVR